MDSLDDRPNKKQAQKLVAGFDQQCELAAEALADADVLLLVTGAGFSADSGLAVYGDVAKIKVYQEQNLEYSDVSQPHLAGKDPEIFYGFWGQSFNDYRKTKPHAGFDIIARWRGDKNRSGTTADEIRERIKMKRASHGSNDLPERMEDDNPFIVSQSHSPYEVFDGPAGAFFSFTSNVDAHFYDKFFANEIYECHGNIELWQCTDRDCPSGIWRAPREHEFEVDISTMRAPSKKSQVKDLGKAPHGTSGGDVDDTSVPHIGHTKGCGQRPGMLQNMPEATDTRWELAAMRSLQKPFAPCNLYVW